jgi:hypothetical protein
MPILLVATQTISRSGVYPTLTAPQVDASGGMYFINNGRCYLEMVADGTAAANTSIVIATPLLVDGQAVADRTVVLPKSQRILIGPFPVGDQTYIQAGGTINYTVGASVTGLTNAVISL